MIETGLFGPQQGSFMVNYMVEPIPNRLHHLFFQKMVTTQALFSTECWKFLEPEYRL